MGRTHPDSCKRWARASTFGRVWDAVPPPPRASHPLAGRLDWRRTSAGFHELVSRPAEDSPRGDEPEGRGAEEV